VSAPGDGTPVVVDVQRVFAEPGQPWAAPRFAEVHPRIRRLVAAFAGRVAHTRFVAPSQPTGAGVDYYAQWPFARQPPDAPLYELVDDPGGDPVVTDACAGASDAGHERALQAMALYAPLLTLTTADAVLAG
jgi:nicotinamidase-related amidase